MAQDYEVTNNEATSAIENANQTIANEKDKANEQIQKAKKEVTAAKQKYSMSRFAWSVLVTGAIILIFLLIFAFQNSQTTSVKFLVWEAKNIPLGLTLICGALAGSIITALIAWVRMRTMRKIIKKNKKQS